MEYIRINRGFTLLELLVVTAIIGIISIVVITSQTTFNNTLLLSNTAYDIALTIRSAQTFGIGSKGTTLGNAGYGINFSSGSPSSFTLFTDTLPSIGNNPSTLCHAPPAYDPVGPSAKPGNCVYDNGEKVTSYSLGNGIFISKLCAFSSSGSSSCGLTSLDITFSRPNSDPFVRINNNMTTSYTRACIAVGSPQGAEKYVSVSATGQIIANAASCP